MLRLVWEFYVYGSVHRWSIWIIVQRDATQSSLFITLQVHSTCFGCQPHPSWVHKTVTTASGTGRTFCVVRVLCTPDALHSLLHGSLLEVKFLVLKVLNSCTVCYLRSHNIPWWLSVQQERDGEGEWAKGVGGGREERKQNETGRVRIM